MEFTLTKTGAFSTNFEFGELTVSGNADIGFRPYQLLVSSVAVCSGGVLKKILEKKRVAFTNITFTANVERDAEQVDKITNIDIHFIVTGTDLKQHVLEKSLETAVKNCSMVESVKDSIRVTETIEARQAE